MSGRVVRPLRVLVFAGTSDGNRLAVALAERDWRVTLCAATEYGRECAPQHANIDTRTGRLDASQIEALLASERFDAVVDATHPYATEVSENLASACVKQNVPLHRLLRRRRQFAQVVEVADAGAAAAFLATTQGNALLTTGSKDLAAYTAVPNYRERLFARVLSTPESVARCHELGFEGRNLIAMQGPFSEELNVAMLRQVDARWLVTKESGSAGGVEAKISAAEKIGAGVVMIRRPRREQGESLAEILTALTGRLATKTAHLVGIGMGGECGMTLEAATALRQSSLVIGAMRMLDAAGCYCHGKRTVAEYRAAHIAEEIRRAEETEIAVVFSGDIGFYSGATALGEALRGVDNVTVRPVCGVSSAAYLCAKLGVPWQGAKLVSAHGRDGNLPGLVRTHPMVFAITGTNTAALLQELCGFGLGDARVDVGAELSYPTERLVGGTAQELSTLDFPPLCAVLIRNPSAKEEPVVPGIPDGKFLRGDVPMTKEEIRAISLSKLRLTRSAVVWDVGAGTGSVSVEAARVAGEGTVYAIERNAEACRLVADNAKRFAAANLKLIAGEAPSALEELPPPTHVFVGGSGGNLAAIVECALRKNPQARIVINTVTLESTQAALAVVRGFGVDDVDITTLSVAKAHEVGGYHLMTSGNPVTIFAFTGKGEQP